MTKRKPNALLAALDGEIADAKIEFARAERELQEATARVERLRAIVVHLSDVRGRLSLHDKKEAAG